MMDRRTLLGGAGVVTALASARPAAAQAASAPVRMNYNENAFGPNPRAMRAAASADPFRYELTEQDELIGVISEKERVPRNHVLISAGSWELLMGAGLLYGVGGKAVVTPAVTFRPLLDNTLTFGGRLETVAMTAEMDIDLAAMERAVSADTGIVYICNPNNPTGKMLDTQALRAFCRRVSARAPVWVDECYLDLVSTDERDSMVDLVREGLPVVVSRSFSKTHAMAGLRVGYALAPPAIGDRLGPTRMSLMNPQAIVAARVSMLDGDFLARSRRRLIESRDALQSALGALGLRYLPSSANFIMFETGKPQGELGRQLRERGVLINDGLGNAAGWARVSAGTGADNAAFVAAMRSIYA